MIRKANRGDILIDIEAREIMVSYCTQRIPDGIQVVCRYEDREDSYKEVELTLDKLNNPIIKGIEYGYVNPQESITIFRYFL